MNKVIAERSWPLISHLYKLITPQCLKRPSHFQKAPNDKLHQDISGVSSEISCLEESNHTIVKNSLSIIADHTSSRGRRQRGLGKVHPSTQKSNMRLMPSVPRLLPRKDGYVWRGVSVSIRGETRNFFNITITCLWCGVHFLKRW